MREAYDTIYASGGYRGIYFRHYKDTPYYPLWREVIGMIDGPVMDLGCGPGQFARMFFDKGGTNYVGVDFSSVAISMARKLCPEGEFRCEDIFLTDTTGYTVVLLEVLEHVERDLELLSGIKGRIILSVPDYDSPTHVRHFRSAAQVEQRYGIKVVKAIAAGEGTIYLADGKFSRIL